MDDLEDRRRERGGWTDERLTAELAKAAADERRALVELLLNLAEFDKRTLSQRSAYSSLFDYCTRKLGYSSSEAGRRIAVARKGDEFPLLVLMIERAELNLTGAGMLAGLLTSDNHRAVLKRAKGKSQDEIARMVAALSPKPVPQDSVRALRAPIEAAGLSPLPSAPSVPPGTVGPAPGTDLFGEPCGRLAPETEVESYAISFAATKETRDLLERAKEPLRHRFPQARTDEIVNLALKKLLVEVDRDLRKPSRAAKPQAEGAKPSRFVPEAVKREAWERDGGQCAFLGPDGTRCTSRAWIEFDHKLAYALGGSSRDSANIQPYCRPHNAWAGRQAFGGPQSDR